MQKSGAPRVLILYASGGMGHTKAAEALSRVFGEQHPGIECRAVNVLDFFNGFGRFIYEDGYNFISAHLIRLWGWLYYRFNHAQRHDFLVSLTRAAMEGRLRAFVDEYRPTFIIGTHPMPVRLLTQRPWKTIDSVPITEVLTDYGCHTFWVDRSIARYFVACDEVRACLTGMGVPFDRVSVTGIPIDPKFARPVDRQAVQRSLKLDPKLPTILVVGGLVSEAYLRTLVARILRVRPAQFLLVSGRDHGLQRKLRTSPLARQPGVTIFGFIQNLEEMLTVADVVITKAGGMTVSECLAKGTPMAIAGIIPGQEEDNIDYLIRHRLAVRAKTAESMADEILRIIANPADVEGMRQRCRTLGHPNATAAVVQAVMGMIEKGPITK
ncbi:MAG: glycosyltransferase [Patescibacteria group bacterium]|nr:glycosyltransferase [Patescibacteria group bacterium]